MLPQIPPDIAPLVYYLCVGSAVLITGISKAGFGGGVGILALPVMALVMPPQHMLGLMLPLLIAADILSNLHYLGQWEWKLLRPLLLGAVLGVAGGTVVLTALKGIDPATFQSSLQLLIGCVCLTVVAMQVYRLFGREVPTLPAHPLSAGSVGFVAGGVSTLSHSAGPIVSIYLLQEKVPKRRLVGTLLLYFLLINTVKVPTYVHLEIINRQTLMDSIWFIPLLPLGTLAGAWMNNRVPEKPFAAIMYTAAAVTAAHLVYRALT
jgi:uncharacterized protein